MLYSIVEMLPLHASTAPRYAQRGGWAGASRRKKLFMAGGLVLLTFSLVLILLVNSDMEYSCTSSSHYRDSASPHCDGSSTLSSPPTLLPLPALLYPRPFPCSPLYSSSDTFFLFSHLFSLFHVLLQVDSETVQRTKSGDKSRVDVARPVAPSKAAYEHEVHEPPRSQVSKPSGSASVPVKSAVVVDEGVEAVKTLRRRQAIIDAFKDAYGTYVSLCGDHDEIHPVAKTCTDWFRLGLTRVDAMDTMYLMGLREEFQDAVQWLDTHFNLDQDVEFSVFEAIIRILGGLLSAYDLSKEPSLLAKAKGFADRLMPAFSLWPSGLPAPVVNMKTGRAHAHSWQLSSVMLAEIGTLQMEFVYLSHATNDTKYAHTALKIFKNLKKAAVAPGLYPTHVKAQDGTPGNAYVTLNALGDSLYEYLFKTWLLMDKKVAWLGELWEEAATAILERLRVKDGDLVYVASLSGNALVHTVDHLACFAAGMYALAANHTDSRQEAERRMEFARDFTFFCHNMYHKTTSGLSPELVTVAAGEMQFKNHLNYLLRPETLESLFYLFRATGNPMYRDWAWEIFEATQKHCKVPSGGYTIVNNVMSEHPNSADLQPSWFLAESLKYLFLTFSDPTVVPLDKYVFNTEAHPLRIFTPRAAEIDIPSS